MKKLLLILLGVLIALPVVAREIKYTYQGQTLSYTVISETEKTVKTNDGYYYSPNNKYYSGNNVNGILIIPSLVEDENGEKYTVTAIGKYGFRTNSLTSVTIPGSVTSIGEDAFFGCGSLKKAEYASVTSMCKIQYQSRTSNPLSYTSNLWIDGKEVKEVTIPTEVDSIPNYAFINCSGLTSVEIPNSVTSIGSSAFAYCSGLTSVTIPNSVTSIGSEVFYYCEGLKSVIIGRSVTSSGSKNFYHCSQLVKGAYPSTISNPFEGGVSAAISYNPEGAIIEDNHIYGPEKKSILFVPLNVQGDYVIPESTESIGKEAFAFCSGLTSVTIPNSVTSIGSGAFRNCYSLKKVEFASVEAICKIKFDDWDSNPLCYAHNLWIDGKEVKELTIPTVVDSIPNYAFNGCSGLTSVTIPGSVTSIGSYAFYGCSGLTSVTIPNSVTSIGSGAFRGCSGLTSVTVESTVPVDILENTWDNSTYNDAMLHIPAGCGTAYFTTNWFKFNHIKVGEYEVSLFDDEGLSYRILDDPADRVAVVTKGQNYDSLTDVFIPERIADTRDSSNPKRFYVIAIAPEAFSNLKNLKSVAFNSRSKISTISRNAFYGCSGLTSVTMPNSVSSIGSYAFYGCSGLTSVTIPDSVTSIGSYAFYGCSGLTSVTIPNSVSSIGSYAFRGCSGLTSVTIPGSVTSIDASAFAYCSGLTSVTIPGSVTSIGVSAFAYCSGLTSVSIPGSVKSIGAFAFEHCNILKKAEFASVASMCKIQYGNEWSNPFTYADNLWIAGKEIKQLTIPTEVDSILNYAFRGCRGLTSVEIPNSVTSIGSSAFAYCSGLTSVEIPNSVTKIVDGVFSSCTGLTSVTIPNSVTEIGRNAFEYCSGLTSVTIPGSVKSLGSNGFYGCDNLTSFEIMEGPEPIKMDNSSLNYAKIETLYLGRPVSDMTFSELTSLTIGNQVDTVQAGMFGTKLKTLKFGSGVKSIADNAFVDNTDLKEVVLPVSLETIGASAFAGCTSMNSIIMGHKVKTIGEKAFDGCPAATVSITAQTPPTAPNNTFSNYTGKLWLQGQAAVEAFYDAYSCWDRFSSFVMVEPSEMQTSGPEEFTGKAGDQIQLQAKLWPQDVTLPQVFWRSTNPDIATVDSNGLVTLQADKEDIIAMAAGNSDDAGRCRIIAESLYANGPSMSFDIFNTSEVDDIVIDRDNNGDDIDYNESFDVYNIHGLYMGQTLENVRAGIYIVRQGTIVKKIVIK